jgi:hypothetical protein
MIPRTVQMAAAVAAQFTSTDLENYGNIILNGYATTGPNSTGKLAWQYQETLTPPVPLPSVTSVQPALKGWTTNYQEYYTQLQPNGYGVNPGDPTMFKYVVHSFDSTGQSRWAQPPHRFYQNQVSAVTPPQYVNNPQVIQYSFMYPVADNPVPPPIDTL